MVRIQQGDIVILDFNPQQGHEQAGRRPAIVLSNNTLNEHGALVMVCPITNTNKKTPVSYWVRWTYEDNWCYFMWPSKDAWYRSEKC